VNYGKGQTKRYSSGLLPVFTDQPDQYTLINFADHTEKFSHDTFNRYLAGKKITPHLVWENVKGQVVQIAAGYLVFDDTVGDKNFSFKMDLVRRQWSGDTPGVIKGIGVVTCVYVNPTLDQFWIIDERSRYSSNGKIGSSASSAKVAHRRS
jgi:hypothetical protein